jgi:hypothetical protein
MLIVQSLCMRPFSRQMEQAILLYALQVHGFSGGLVLQLVPIFGQKLRCEIQPDVASDKLQCFDCSL